MTLSTTAFSAAASETWVSPCSSRSCRIGFPFRGRVSTSFLEAVAEIAPLSRSSTACAIVSGESFPPRIASFQWMHSFAVVFGFPTLERHGRLEEVGQRPADARIPASYFVIPYRPVSRATFSAGSSGGPAQLLDPLVRDDQRQQVRSGKYR